MAKRTPTGNPQVGGQPNQNIILTGLVTFTGSTIVDLKRAVRQKGKGINYVAGFAVIGLTFEDTGGAATTQRLADQQNGDGTFTIYASQETTTAGTWQTSTNACTVRWTVLVTE